MKDWKEETRETVAAEKAALRRLLRPGERQWDPADRAEASRAMTRRLLALPQYQSAATVCCFVGMPWEPDTGAVLRDALAGGKRLCVPRCTGPGEMEMRLLPALHRLSPGSMGIPEPTPDTERVEPEEVAFAVIPCLACDRTGRRLGRGGGYYDRFLARFHGFGVLLCREARILDSIPTEPHDIAVPWVLTERGLYHRGILLSCTGDE